MAHRFIAVVLVVLSAAVGAHAAAPSPTAFEVEVVVFETRLPDLEAGELWTLSTKKPADAPEAIAPPAVAAGGSELSAAVTALQNDQRFRVLTHQRWVQPAEAKAATKPVLVRSGDREVDGTLLFYVNRFLHVELNLGFQPPRGVLGSSAPVAEPNGALYRINEQRRIKSQEVHYFDHPKFGVLVRVAPASAGAIAATP